MKSSGPIWTVRVILFSVASFCGAALIFVVQPMVAKAVVPTLGGAAAVWTVSMLFFQGGLLAGYGWVHLLTSRCSRQLQGVVHLGWMALAAFTLPIVPEISTGSSLPAAVLLLGTLVVQCGPVFVVLAGTAPLLQSWLSASTDDPYFLYAASNLGSFCGLLGYPLFVEPAITLGQQGAAWSLGYGALVGLLVTCALLTRRPRRPTDRKPTRSTPPWPKVGLWLLTSAVPSSLMLGFTTHTTEQVAAVPFLWIVPLALYLLTFVLAFARRRLVPQELLSKVLPYVLVVWAPVLVGDLPTRPYALLPAHLAVMFLICLYLHQKLVDSRPAAEQLTAFYMWMAVGGVLGGVFNGLLAPAIFVIPLELPVALAAACWLLPPSGQQHTLRRDLLAVGMLLLFGIALLAGIGLSGIAPTSILARSLIIGMPCVVCFGFKERPRRFALGYLVVSLLLAFHIAGFGGETVYRSRNFFGTKRVFDDPTTGLRTLLHGGTRHGIERVDAPGAPEPLAYYHRGSPVADVLEAIANSRQGLPTRTAVIGLGVGSIAAFAKANDHMRFFEIDPAIAAIAAKYFRFMGACGDRCDVRVGDGRLLMGEEAPAAFDTIILDAFNAGSVPTHLLTQEALSLYLSRAKEGGVVAIHVSNEYLRLESVVAASAALLPAEVLVRYDLGAELKPVGALGSVWVALSKGKAVSSHLRDTGWVPLVAVQEPPWTDQRVSLLPYLRW